MITEAGRYDFKIEIVGRVFSDDEIVIVTCPVNYGPYPLHMIEGDTMAAFASDVFVKLR